MTIVGKSSFVPRRTSVSYIGKRVVVLLASVLRTVSARPFAFLRGTRADARILREPARHAQQIISRCGNRFSAGRRALLQMRVILVRRTESSLSEWDVKRMKKNRPRRLFRRPHWKRPRQHGAFTSEERIFFFSFFRSRLFFFLLLFFCFFNVPCAHRITILYTTYLLRAVVT